MGIKNRLNQLEDELNEGLVEVKVEDGGEFYANKRDLLSAIVESTQWAAGKINKDDLSEKTLKFFNAKEGQRKPCDLIRETLELAEDRNDIS